MAKEWDWQRELWAREHRRQAHIDFLAEQRRLDHWMMQVTRIGGENVAESTPGWAEPLGKKLLDVQVFGGQAGAVAARRLYKATRALQDGTVGAMMAADEAIETFRRLVQRDLELDETGLPPWGAEDEPAWAAVGRP